MSASPEPPSEPRAPPSGVEDGLPLDELLAPLLAVRVALPRLSVLLFWLLPLPEAPELGGLLSALLIGVSGLAGVPELPPELLDALLSRVLIGVSGLAGVLEPPPELLDALLSKVLIGVRLDEVLGAPLDELLDAALSVLVIGASGVLDGLLNALVIGVSGLDEGLGVSALCRLLALLLSVAWLRLALKLALPLLCWMVISEASGLGMPLGGWIGMAAGAGPLRLSVAPLLAPPVPPLPLAVPPPAAPVPPALPLPERLPLALPFMLALFSLLPVLLALAVLPLELPLPLLAVPLPSLMPSPSPGTPLPSSELIDPPPEAQPVSAKTMLVHAATAICLCCECMVTPCWYESDHNLRLP